MPKLPGRGDIPPATFKNFITELASTALVCLGYIQSPVLHRNVIELARAEHLIELLDMLHVKTHGNLNDEERLYLETVLEDLRVKLMERQAQALQQPPPPGPPSP